MPTSPTDICLEHIDPVNSDHICGLRVPLNEILAEGSYNYAKTNKFVPYRVKDHPAPVNPGDLCEFLINGDWVVLEFYSEPWHAEARRIGCSSNKNRVCHTNPELHREISRRGAESLLKLGYNFASNGCHTSENQSKRVQGKAFWYNPVTGHGTRSIKQPGEGYEKRRKPFVNGNQGGWKWWYNPETDHQVQAQVQPGPNYLNQRRPK